MGDDLIDLYSVKLLVHSAPKGAEGVAGEDDLAAAILYRLLMLSLHAILVRLKDLNARVFFYFRGVARSGTKPFSHQYFASAAATSRSKCLCIAAKSQHRIAIGLKAEDLMIASA